MTRLHQFIEKYRLIIVATILATMFALSFAAMIGDSAITDEIAHIPSGYSYLKYGDYRLNPEHPPLIKELAAFPLLFLDLKFPIDQPAWTQSVNGQWDSGWNFLYNIGNNADKMLFASRLPVLLLAIGLGYVIYEFCRRRYGNETALLALILYAFSPNIIAHDHYVTTDLGIAAFTFFAFIAFFYFLQRRSRKSIIVLAIFFALAQLAKFSAIILLPYFGLLLILKIIFDKRPPTWLSRARHWLVPFFVAMVGALALIWLFYTPATVNMPNHVQDSLIRGSLPDGYYTRYGQYLVKLNDIPGMKPIVQFALGIFMVSDRVQSGNTTYFLGDVTNQSFFWYFPVSFVMKTPIPMLIMILVGLGLAIWQYAQKIPTKVWQKLGQYTRNNFVELAFGGFIIFYSYLSIKGNLNLGIRHLFPMMPMIFILVAKKTIDFGKLLTKPRHKRVYKIGLLGLSVWYIATAFVVYPNYLPYINGLFGGSSEAYRYMSDSNVDWGQDLKRFVKYVDNNPQIDKIALDYFGGGLPQYYLCDRKFDSNGAMRTDANSYDCKNSKLLVWHVGDGVPPTAYIAVSETLLENDIYSARQRGDSGYAWLRAQTPIAKIGDSIYVYKIR